MKKRIIETHRQIPSIRFISIFLLLFMILSASAGCGNAESSNDLSKTSKESGQTSAVESDPSEKTPSKESSYDIFESSDEESSKQSESEESFVSAPASQPSSASLPENSASKAEEMPTLPESGELKALSWNSQYLPESFEGINPRVENGVIAVAIEGASLQKGLAISENTEITYKITNKTGQLVEEGTTTVDRETFSEMKSENGYLGICIPVNKEFKRKDQVYLVLSFTDDNGNAYTLKKTEVFYGLQYFGITPKTVDLSEIGVSSSISRSYVEMKGIFDGIEYTLDLNLSKWEGNTSIEQIITCCKLFFGCYPKMYERFGKTVGAVTKLTLAFENSGYEIASASGDFVHIHDCWLKDHPTDFDCLTHEFAHVIQNGWDGNYCQYSGFIERFADYCRYVYAYNDGYYNDLGWELQTGDSENTLEDSVRFLAYLDYFYSTKEIDIVLRFYQTAYFKRYSAAQWNKAWEEIFKGTELEGKTVGEVFSEYLKSDFSSLSSKAKRQGLVSPLNKKFDLRTKLRERSFS